MSFKAGDRVKLIKHDLIWAVGKQYLGETGIVKFAFPSGNIIELDNVTCSLNKKNAVVIAMDSECEYVN